MINLSVAHCESVKTGELTFAWFEREYRSQINHWVNYFWSRVYWVKNSPLCKVDLRQILLTELWSSISSYQWRCRTCKCAHATRAAFEGHACTGVSDLMIPIDAYTLIRSRRALSHEVRKYIRRIKYGAEIATMARASDWSVGTLQRADYVVELSELVREAGKQLTAQQLEILSKLAFNSPVQDRAQVNEVRQWASSYSVTRGGGSMTRSYGGSRSRARVERELVARSQELIRCDSCGLFRSADHCQFCSGDVTSNKVVRMQNVVSLGNGESKGRVVRRAVEPETPNLENIEKKILELRESAGGIEWEIGRQLTVIFDNDLWQSAGEEYSSFSDYVSSKFEFSRQTARAYMEISQKFTPEQAGKYPLGHLRLLVKVPEASDRDELMAKIDRDSPTFRELATAVKAKRQEQGLNTERRGLDGTTLVNARLPHGVVAEGEWKKRGPKKRLAEFLIGDHHFVIEDLLGEESFVLKLLPPRE